jgi:hypothetical protein
MVDHAGQTLLRRSSFRDAASWQENWAKCRRIKPLAQGSDARSAYG